MPCYDKKVEASRKEFEKNGKKEVDMVLTCTEFMELIKELEKPKLEKLQNKELNEKNLIFPYNDDLTDIDELILKADEKYKNSLYLSQLFGVNFDPLKALYAQKIDFTSNGYLEYIMNHAA